MSYATSDPKAVRVDQPELKSAGLTSLLALGLDIGSVSISCALMNSEKEVLRTAHLPHRGRVAETLASVISELGPIRSAVACTSSGPRLIPLVRSFDPQICLISSVRKLLGQPGSILFVGGEKFGLIRFDGQGRYRGTRSNTSCAAGTGSFLDQQARRLGFPGTAELCKAALGCSGTPPKISTRCAVFARTDLVHAQQSGYSIEEICAGLCRGLAQNIADTLLGGEAPREPVVFAGGVSRNGAVLAHLEEILGVRVVTHELAPVFGAIGACLNLLEDGCAEPIELGAVSPKELLLPQEGGKQYFFAPLDLDNADMQGSDGERRFVFQSGRFSRIHPIEVDVYRVMAPGDSGVFLGIDIGSTSTKAVLMDRAEEPLAGFYTRTLGSPLSAVQAISEAIADFETHEGQPLSFLGVAATGAGRSFIGSIVGADLIVNEITAHAKAAYALDPLVDTIIEIGGQDAKFTTMKDGMVTFSHMNTVCAAGTGSFLEEQAARLECDLDAYAERVRGVRAPLASDRCAVFMERDINNFLGQGFSAEEILAAALFSVRENYMQKVARGATIGRRICFQGATARNRALVAAFRQGLGKPVSVSRYCHLTGAIGAALLLREQGLVSSRFRGLKALRDDIPLRAETCSLCANHCRLSIATVDGQTVAYGFLCGRDYDSERYVDGNVSGFDLQKERKRAFTAAAAAPGQAARGHIRGGRTDSSGAERGRGPSGPAKARAPDGPAPNGRAFSGPVIGIPAALSLYEHLALWKRFFSSLSIPFITSEGFSQGIERGREVQGAEFCAPLAALHGHVRHLMTKADFVFLPVAIEEKDRGSKALRSYCYYTQFSAALASGIEDGDVRERCISPLVSFTKGKGRTKRELFQALSAIHPSRLTYGDVSRAFEDALEYHHRSIRHLRQRFFEEMKPDGEPRALLIGRPYTILSPEAGKGIAEIFGSLGIKAFSQDMLTYTWADVADIAPLLGAFQWYYAARALEAAAVAAKTPGLYPVYVTSFKCSPDSFALEYFKRILDSCGKPYLVLQLDDHDSTVGYRTRIEAGVASFRSHLHGSMQPRAGGPGKEQPRALPIVPRVGTALTGKTLLLPTWDPMVAPLLAANLRREGIDAHALSEDPVVIRKAMRHNTGQCLPLNIIAQEFMDYIETHALDPSRTALWMIRSGISCNLGMFPFFIKSLLEAHGGGMEKAEVYTGDISHIEISARATLNAYRAYLVGGLLRRVCCRIRPYERERGAADRAARRALEILVPAFEGAASRRDALDAVVALFADIPLDAKPRPKAAIFGDLYVRDNDVMNQDLIRAIEEAGGEALTTPYTEYIAIVLGSYLRRWRKERKFVDLVKYRALWVAATALSRGYRARFRGLLGEEHAVGPRGEERMLRKFGVRDEHAGESLDNLLKVLYLAASHPDLALFVQASPAFCCPSLVTEAMASDIERLTGVPVVSITYDGTGQYRNDAVVPYLRFALNGRVGS